VLVLALDATNGLVIRVIGNEVWRVILVARYSRTALLCSVTSFHNPHVQVLPPRSDSHEYRGYRSFCTSLRLRENGLILSACEYCRGFEVLIYLT
jgi:hypothetical protein